MAAETAIPFEELIVEECALLADRFPDLASEDVIEHIEYVLEVKLGPMGRLLAMREYLVVADGS